MTAIESLWEKARTDPQHQAVNGSLLEQATIICTSCGLAVSHDAETGCISCRSCGTKECTDA